MLEFRVMGIQHIQIFDIQTTDAVCSIIEPKEPPVSFLGQPASTLRLVFHDIEREIEGHVAPRLVDAINAIAWIRALPPYVTRVIVHCRAGISRSPAVAYGLRRALGIAEPFADFAAQFPYHNRRILYLFEEALANRVMEPAANSALQEPVPKLKTRKEIPLISVPNDLDMIAEEMADLFDEDRVTHKHGSSEPEAD